MKQTGMKPSELEELIECPDTMRFVWTYFIELHNARSFGGMQNLNPLSYSDIKAYFDLMNIVPEEWEVKMIKRLDHVALSQYAEDSRKEAEKNKRKSKK